MKLHRDKDKLETLEILGSGKISWYDIDAAVDGLDITPLYPASRYPGYDCQMWAFEQIGFIPNKDFSHARLRDGDIPEFIRVNNLEEGLLVAYICNKNNNFSFAYEHFGISVVDYGIMVESKWDIGHVYRHPISYVPLKYGDEVDFFKIMI